MTEDELIDRITYHMKDASESLAPEDYENAVSDVKAETGWNIPASSSLQELWFVNRAKRHLIFYLMTGSASKFQAKSFALNQKFDHYKAILELMDMQWDKFKDENPQELSVSPESFGTVVGTGLAYDRRGREYNVSTIG